MLARTACAAALIGAALVSVFGLLHGWWHVNRPKAARFSVRGVDVSRHQGDIRWAVVAREGGTAFAYLKATEGGDWTDPRFSENWREAKRAGLLVGSYHFFTFCRPALDQAEHFLATVPHDPEALPPAVDVEYAGNCHEVPPPEIVRHELMAWLDAVEDAIGKVPVIYVTAEAHKDFLQGAPLKNPLWIRSLLGEPKVQWLFWQYEARGTVKGIDGLVDLNVFIGDPAALGELASGRAGHSFGTPAIRER